MSSPFPAFRASQAPFNPNANLLQANREKKKKKRLEPAALVGWLVWAFCGHARRGRCACQCVCGCTRAREFPLFFFFSLHRVLSAWCIYNWRAGSVRRCGVVSHCLGCPGAPGTPVGIKVVLIKCRPRRTALCIAGPTESPRPGCPPRAFENPPLALITHCPSDSRADAHMHPPPFFFNNPPSS